MKVTLLTSCTAYATRWMGGWELHVVDPDGTEIGVTQVRVLERAVAQVRDYLATLYDLDVATAERITVFLTPKVDGLEEEAQAARAQQRAAADSVIAAAARTRDVAQQLRAAGLSVSDTAAILGVSRGRVSQLLAEARPRRQASA